MYPTWADLVATNFDFYENWGGAGGGNTFISTQLYECNQQRNITKDDTVLIMFSSFTRYDFIIDSNWKLSGNLYSQTNINFDFLENCWSEEHGYVSSWFAIKSAINLLDNIGCNYKIMTAFDLLRFSENITKSMDDIRTNRVKNCMDDFKTILPAINLLDYAEYLEDNDIVKFYRYFRNGKLDKDRHPTLTMHLMWVKDVLPQFHNEKMDEMVKEWETWITTSENEISNKFRNIVDKGEPKR